MKKTKFNLKKLVALALTAACLLGNVMTAQAATWNQNNAGWNLTKDNGQLAKSEWQLVNGAWYHFDGNGKMQTGWIQDAGKWYYLHSSGAMATGWVQDDGYWYYLDGSGAMQTMKWIGDFYVGPTGAMLTNLTTPDGYYVGADGRWIPKNESANASSKLSEGFQTDFSTYTVNIGATLSMSTIGDNIEIDYFKIEDNSIASASYNPSNSTKFNIHGKSEGKTTLTLYTYDGRSTSCEVIVLSSLDTSGTTGIQFFDSEAKKIATIVNDYRISQGTHSLSKSELGISISKAQLITNCREAERRAEAGMESYDINLHNGIQNSTYVGGVNTVNEYAASHMVRNFQNSPGHNRCMLNPEHQEFGVALAITKYGIQCIITYDFGDGISSYLDY